MMEWGYSLLVCVCTSGMIIYASIATVPEMRRAAIISYIPLNAKSEAIKYRLSRRYCNAYHSVEQFTPRFPFPNLVLCVLWRED